MSSHFYYLHQKRVATLRQAVGMGPLKPLTYFSPWSSLCPRPGDTGTSNNYQGKTGKDLT